MYVCMYVCGANQLYAEGLLLEPLWLVVSEMKLAALAAGRTGGRLDATSCKARKHLSASWNIGVASSDTFATINVRQCMAA